MMTLLPTGTVESSPGAAASPGANPSMPSVRGMVTKPVSLRRRHLKGTIAGFAHGKKSENTASQSEPNGEAGSSDNTGSIGASSSAGQGHPPQHVVETSSAPTKPCHSARLALLCCHNAIRMGARTQLSLCPPGRARRTLQTALRTRSRNITRAPIRSLSSSLKGESELGGYYGLDKMLGPDTLADYDEQEEDFLLNTNTFDIESDEEASSGDEDELLNVEDLLSSDSAPSLDDKKKYAKLREQLFTPTGVDPTVSNPNGAPGMSTATSGKLPFNRRKLRYFDSVSASDRMAARAYLTEETKKCKQRDGIMLAKHLRRMQRRERRRIQIERGELPDFDHSDEENDDPKEKALLAGGVSQFQHTMTASMSAALVLESLSLNPLQSIEGMAKCYDGIVAAGVALLDSRINASGDEEIPRHGRSEIMAALAPLLITSLEQASGEVIVHLAKLRRMCGTPRYQRRFVQRVAPCLIRPPQAAMWCLRHQNDMEPILAAAELIFDCAFEIFSKGWYERGQLLLADSARKQTLRSAAEQLKNLSSEPEDGLNWGLNSTGHNIRRTSILMKAAAPTKDGSNRSGGNERLTEWEVIAVDRQIRIAISNIISSDWARVVVSSRDPEVLGRGYRRSASSAALSMGRSRSGGDSPKGMPSPRSPHPPKNSKTPLSPPLVSTNQGSGLPVPESIESVFGPSFALQSSSALVHSTSLSPDSSEAGMRPQGPLSTPLSPPLPRRPGFEVDPDSKSMHRDPFTTSPSPGISTPAPTPPRSPNSPPRLESTANAAAMSLLHSASPPTLTAVSSVRSQALPSGDPQNPSAVMNPSSLSALSSLERVDRAPLSPLSVGGSSVVSEAVPFRPASSAASVSSANSSISQPSHYRMLTSTAAERKRTVAACRALRAQISRFEEAFLQLHGRAPKGAAERAPLATTYAQYREWKRAIRADAACRIQALFRGARTRWILLRSNNSRIARVVLTRAGRLSFNSTTEQQREKGQPESMLQTLSIPVEIGANDASRPGLVMSPLHAGALAPIPHSQPYGDVANHGVEVFIKPPAPTAPSSVLNPHWSSSLPRRRSGGNELFPSHGAPTPPQYSSPHVIAPPPGPAVSLSHMSLPELQAHKRDLKQQLKQYDMNFARKHGRMPVKAEKEPIRHLYESYNALKSQITMIEQEGQHLPSPSMQPSGGLLIKSTPSPPLSMTSGPDSGSDDSSSNAGQGLMMVRPKRKPVKSPPFAESPISVASTPSGAPSQDLAALKAEKGKLHQMLRSYEKDFFKEHKRQVSSFADIKPVASQYRRYKEIKKAIASLQQGGSEK